MKNARIDTERDECLAYYETDLPRNSYHFQRIELRITKGGALYTIDVFALELVCPESELTQRQMTRRAIEVHEPMDALIWCGEYGVMCPPALCAIFEKHGGLQSMWEDIPWDPITLRREDEGLALARM